MWKKFLSIFNRQSTQTSPSQAPARPVFCYQPELPFKN